LKAANIASSFFFLASSFAALDPEEVEDVPAVLTSLGPALLLLLLPVCCATWAMKSRWNNIRFFLVNAMSFAFTAASI
jgi:hypothetical protein